MKLLKFVRYFTFSKRGELPQAHLSTLVGKWLSPVRTRDFSGWGFSFPPQPNIIINKLNLELL
nr:MAG TPA: hypothetical protein [Caudoviricetes sp.]